MLWITWSLAVEDEQADLDAVASRVLMRAQRSTAQARTAFTELAANDAPPCSPRHIGLMRRVVFNTPAIEEVGYSEGGQLKCTSWGVAEPGIRFARPDFHFTDGLGVTLAVKPALPGGTTKLAYSDGSYDVLLEPIRLVDVIADPQVQLALTARDGRLMSQLNDPDRELVADLAAHPRSAMEGRYSFAAIRSTNWTAIAIEPRPALFGTLRRQQWILIPIGLFIAGLIVAAVAWVSRQRLSFGAELAAAIRKREFCVHYQPTIDLQTGACVGAEALLRWQRSDGTWIRPDLFIPAAEHSGMIGPLTELAIACIAADIGPRLASDRSLHIAINIPPELLASDAIFDWLDILTSGAGVNPSQIWLEATERSFVDDGTAHDAIARARSAGYRIAMDDFGTGYSSLGHLQKLAFDTLKIDKSFVDTIGVASMKSAVISHIIDLAKELEIAIVAEGVEREAQADYLRERRVQFAQGWLFARALPPAEFLKYLADHSDAGSGPQ
ncbi:EAL domain-containing protein [Novosphingobium resinovorum]|nr:EAL domain-containing protein [Novosphingobium resinovorum]